MEASDFCLIHTTTDSQQNADAITQLLLNKHLVACVQASNMKSTYHWQGETRNSEEILLTMKTQKSLFEKIQAEITQVHSYDVPEIIMVPLEGANESYLAWLHEETINDQSL